MPQIPRLEFYSLRTADLDYLLQIETSWRDFFRHDVSQPLAAIRNNAAVIADEGFDRTSRLAACRDIQEDAQRLWHLLNRLTREAPAQISAIMPFLASMAAALTTDAPGVHLAVCDSSPPALRILFPANILYAIVFELVNNAARHASPSRVVLQWDMDLDSIIVSVHDIGRGLLPLLTDQLLDLRLSAPSLFSRGVSGLSVVYKVMYAGHGLLLGRRSPITPGAEIAIRMPIRAYSRDEPVP